MCNKYNFPCWKPSTSYMKSPQHMLEKCLLCSKHCLCLHQVKLYEYAYQIFIIINCSCNALYSNIFFLGGCYWDLNLGLHTCEAGTVLIQTSLVILEIGYHYVLILAWTASSDSWNDRCMLACAGLTFFQWDVAMQTFDPRLFWNCDPPDLQLEGGLRWHVHATMSGFYWLRWNLTNSLYSEWPWITILPISTSQLGRITGMNHQCWISYIPNSLGNKGFSWE
jgi:hypothetical protein